MWPHVDVWITVNPEVMNHRGCCDVVRVNSEQWLRQMFKRRPEDLGLRCIQLQPVWTIHAATSSTQMEMLFWSCNDADGEQNPHICVSSAYRQRPWSSISVSRSAVYNRMRIGLRTDPVVHCTRSQLEWKLWIRLKITGVGRQGTPETTATPLSGQKPLGQNPLRQNPLGQKPTRT